MEVQKIQPSSRAAVLDTGYDYICFYVMVSGEKDQFEFNHICKLRKSSL